MKISVFTSCLAASLTFFTSVNSQQVTRNGVNFELNGAPFNFAGTNIYDAAFQDTKYATDVVDAVVANGYRVLRCWAFNEYDTAHGSAPTVYFQSWTNGVPTPNAGSNGLALLDAVVAEAEKKGLKLILTLTNNWTDYGGMDVYLNATLHPGAYHDLFYTDPNVATHYMNYVQAVVSRYANSPAIFAWELANEARCAGTGPNPQSPSACSPAVVTAWVDKMSSYIKSLDSNHMVSLGFEGFYNRPNTANNVFEYDGGSGQDFDALLALKNVDIGTSHIYLDGSSSSSYIDLPWSQQWLADHNASGVAAGKPVIQEEYGVNRSDPKYNQQQVYDQWHAQILQSSAINGDMTWGSLVVDGACPGADAYAVCESDAGYADIVTDWVTRMNGKQ